MVAKRTRPALQSCKHQCYESNDPNDPLSRLPDDLLFIIMSFLTIEEAARISVLSHRWNYLWRRFPVLIFEDLTAMKRMFKYDESIPQERSSFLRRVNRVLEGHLGQSVDELRVTFYLNKRCQSDMDGWLAFALAKQVKRLELDFAPPYRGPNLKSLPKWHLPLNNNLTVFKSCLSSLSLKYVNVTTKDTDCFLSSFVVLENLCIEYSRSLTCVRDFGLPLRLKHFEVSYCPRLRTVDILAPKLLSFVHHGKPIKLRIRNASLLSRLSLGLKICDQDIVAYAFDPLSKYFPQLEYLNWSVQMFQLNQEFNLGIKKPPSMTNLKHLELDISALCTQSVFGWADLMEAAPLLEKLTLKFLYLLETCRMQQKIVKRRAQSQSLKSFKTLKLDLYLGSAGCPIDLEIATYVVENSIMLKDVIVVLSPEQWSNQDENHGVAEYKRLVPNGVKLTFTTKGVNHQEG